jgi:hypothetical protein
MNKLEFLLVCESAFLSQGSASLNLINIFDSIGASKFPAVHPKFCIVSSIKTNMGPHELRLIIKKNNIIIAEPRVNFIGESHRWINTLVGIAFPEAGVYPIELYLDGILLGNTSLSIGVGQR